MKPPFGEYRRPFFGARRFAISRSFEELNFVVWWFLWESIRFLFSALSSASSRILLAKKLKNLPRTRRTKSGAGRSGGIALFYFIWGIALIYNLTLILFSTTGARTWARTRKWPKSVVLSSKHQLTRIGKYPWVHKYRGKVFFSALSSANSQFLLSNWLKNLPRSTKAKSGARVEGYYRKHNPNTRKHTQSRQQN